MAITVKHSKVSTIPDTTDTDLVRPSDWNADHVLTGTIPVANGGTGADNATDARTNLGAAASGANSDITSMSGITGAITSPDYIGFDTAYSTTLAAGQLGWDGNNTLGLGMAGGNVVQHIGEDQFYYVKASSAITKGQVCMFTGAVGASGVLTAAPASGSIDGLYIMGIAAESIALNGFGLIQSFGTLRNINTSAYTDGAILYYDPTVTGAFTSTRPAKDKTQVVVAAVANAANNGALAIRVSYLPEFADLVNVSISSPTTGQGLVYNSGTGLWSNSNAEVVIGGSVDNSPIGATTASTGKFTTLEATGTSSLGTASAQYIQAIGDATYPQIKAAGSGTNIPLVLQPKGTGALQAQLTDSTATGGNARGANAVDWQTSRAAASQVASGQTSVVAGGVNNTASGLDAAVLGGSGNNASASFAMIGAGNSNNASNIYSTVVNGRSNTAGGYFNFIGGGDTNSGTANAAVTTQATTTVTSGSTAVTLSGSNAAIKVGQLITGTGINNFTYVAAISGTSLTLSQNAGSSGTPTLSFFTPHGVVVGGGNNQATGSYSFIGGGGDAGTAVARNTASGDWGVVCGGKQNTASANGAFVGGGGTYGGVTTGQGNTASSDCSAVVGGILNNAAGFGGFIGGGYNNYVDGQYGAILGGSNGRVRAIRGNQVNPAKVGTISVAGDSQAALLILSKQTTDATATVLISDGAAAGTTNQVILPNNSAYYFRGEIVAGVTGGGNTKGWFIEGVIKRGANAASTALVGSATVTSNYADAGASTWTIAVAADTTNGGLKVTATGQAATTIRWVAQIRTTEMTY